MKEKGLPPYNVGSPEERIRLVLHDLRIVAALEHTDMSKFGKLDYDPDLPEVIQRWSGVDPRKVEGGMEIVEEVTALVRREYTPSEPVNYNS